jgi:hypothetical protein
MGGDRRWIELAKYRVQWRALVSVALNSWVILNEFYLPTLSDKHPGGKEAGA